MLPCYAPAAFLEIFPEIIPCPGPKLAPKFTWYATWPAQATLGVGEGYILNVCTLSESPLPLVVWGGVGGGQISDLNTEEFFS